MSRRDAPLYLRAHGLARWVLQHAGGWPPAAGGALAAAVSEAACALVCEVSLALTFPPTRAAHLQAVDHAIVRLRTLLRLAADLGLLRPSSLAFAAGELRDIGRMTGGWRKRVDRSLPSSGDGSPAASTV